MNKKPIIAITLIVGVTIPLIIFAITRPRINLSRATIPIAAQKSAQSVNKVEEPQASREEKVTVSQAPAVKSAVEENPTPTAEISALTEKEPVAEATPTAAPEPAVAKPPGGFAGTDWRSLGVAGGGGTTGIVAHPTNPDVVYMASDNSGLYKTENGGDSWFSVTANLGAYRLGFVTLDPLNADVIYVTASTDFGGDVAGGATGEMHRSLNGGQSWEFVTDLMGFQSSFPSQTSLVLPYDPDNPARFDQDGDGLTDVIIVAAWTGPADPPVGGIWRSDDEGASFAHLALQEKNMTGVWAFPGDANLLFATTNDGQVYRSPDLGESWEAITANLPLTQVSDMALHPTDSNILYVTCRACVEGQDAVWKTVDGGQSWQGAGRGLNTREIAGFPRILMDRFDPETLYVTTFRAVGHEGSIRKTSNGGRSWEMMPARLVLPDGRPFHTFEFERQLTIGQAVDGTLYAGGSGAWRFPDGDQNDGVAVWEPATIGLGNVHVNDIEVDPQNQSVLYQGISDFGPYKSIDQGETFHRNLGNGWPVTVENFVWNGPYYSNYKHCSLICSDSCNSSAKIASGGTYAYAISRQDSDVIYSAFGSGSGGTKHGGINKSLDGGVTWFPVGFQLEDGFELNPKTCVPYGFRHVAVDSTNDQIAFAAQEIPDTGETIIFKSTDGGERWEVVYVSDRALTELDVSSVDPNLVIFTTRAGAYKSEQGGAPDSWQEITPPEAKDIRVMSLSPHERDVFVIGTNAQGIYYSADGGVTWQQNSLSSLFKQQVSQDNKEPLPAEQATAFNTNRNMIRNILAIAFDPIEPNVFFVAGRQPGRASVGVARITNGGQNWERLPLAGLSQRSIFDLAIDSAGQYLYAGTYNGTYQFELR